MPFFKPRLHFTHCEKSNGDGDKSVGSYRCPAPRTSHTAGIRSTAAASGRCCCSRRYQQSWAERSAQRPDPNLSSWWRRAADLRCTLTDTRNSPLSETDLNEIQSQECFIKKADKGKVPVNLNIWYFLCRFLLFRITCLFTHSNVGLWSRHVEKLLLLQECSNKTTKVTWTCSRWRTWQKTMRELTCREPWGWLILRGEHHEVLSSPSES